MKHPEPPPPPATLKRQSEAISAWENEGGAIGAGRAGQQYGRRIEADRSWTVYHVFTGIPALVDGLRMTGLDRAAATRRMLSLNLHGIADGKRRPVRSSGANPIPATERPS